MEKYYEIMQINAIGNGYTTTVAIVINPTFEGGGIKATQVGEWDGNVKSYNNGRTAYVYSHIEAREFMICGNVTCVERVDDPFSDMDGECG